MWPATVGFTVFTDTQKFQQIDRHTDSFFLKCHHIKVIQIKITVQEEKHFSDHVC